MIAESQFCWSGDHTLEATRTAMKKASEAKAEQRYVIVLSDANFSRYGIRPADFANLMVSDPLVNVYAIFIGSLGNQAMRRVYTIALHFAQCMFLMLSQQVWIYTLNTYVRM